MKNQRHKRKEIYSVLLVSNTNGQSRQFQISAFTLRLCICLILLLCAVTGWLIYRTSIASRAQQKLQQELSSQAEQLQQLETEKDALTKDKLTLAAENEGLRQKNEALVAEAEAPKEEEETAPSLPSHYPSDGASVLKTSFSDEHPYITISTYTGGHIVAAGDGTVIAVSSDDTYPRIIEIEHEGGYKTRYLCHEEAELNTEEGTAVQAGDTLLTITSDDCDLDYQVLLNDEVLDPLSVIDAKG